MTDRTIKISRSLSCIDLLCIPDQIDLIDKIDLSCLHLLDDFEWPAKVIYRILNLDVDLGCAGQKTCWSGSEQIRKMCQRSDKAGVGIEVDGNVEEDTVPKVVKAGANILTGGTSDSSDIKGSTEDDLQKMMEAVLI